MLVVDFVHYGFRLQTASSPDKLIWLLYVKLCILVYNGGAPFCEAHFVFHDNLTEMVSILIPSNC